MPSGDHDHAGHDNHPSGDNHDGRQHDHVHHQADNYHGSDDDDREGHHHDNDRSDNINISIDIHDGPGIVYLHDWRNDNIRAYVNIDNPANHGTVIDVLRTIHDRCPVLYHSGEYQHGCTWCDDNAAAHSAPGGGAPGDG